MLRKILVLGNSLALAASIAMASSATQPSANLSADEIVSKNVAARGGLQAWRAVQTMSLEGKLGAGGNQRTPMPVPVEGRGQGKLHAPVRPAEEAQLPFVMKMERPRKSRLEIKFNGQTAVQVYDGTNGWKLRPFLNRNQVEPYSPDELKAASLQPDIDGPLVDYAAKGTRVELEGIEKVEDRDTYKLKLTLKDGHSLHVWIDTQTFLEARIDGQPRRLDGKEHQVQIYYRDYRPVGGLQFPFVLETRVVPIESKSKFRELPVPPEKIVVDKIEVNPQFSASLFVRPEIQSASNHN